MPLVDVHAHLCDPAFEADLDSVLERAREAGIAAIVAVGETLDDARRNLELARAHPGMVLPCAGLFPTILDEEQAARMEAWIRAHREEISAIGEVGLDRVKVREAADVELQRRIFGRFVALSRELDLPLNVHSRSAGRESVSFLIDRGARRVVLHAFDGKAASALAGVEAGYLFSVPPSVVRSQQKQKMVRRLPLSSLLLETDSPVLGPSSTERNEPANLRIALRTVAELKGISEEMVAETTSESACRLFRIGLGAR